MIKLCYFNLIQRTSDSIVKELVAYLLLLKIKKNLMPYIQDYVGIKDML